MQLKREKYIIHSNLIILEKVFLNNGQENKS